MNASDIEALRRAALKAISEKSGIKHPVLVHSSEDVIPSSGKKIFLFSATEKDKGNSPPSALFWTNPAQRSISPNSVPRKSGLSSSQ